jgi:hypothetical protein
MKWLKAAFVGALGSLIMFALLFVGIHVSGFAPFNVPPSAAFLETLGLNVGPLPLLVHFGYGATWSVVLVALYDREVTTGRGVGMAMALWLFMMAVYSPIIGWGFFGFGGPNHALTPDAALYLGSGVKYVVATLLLHLIYGAVIGKGNEAWTVAAANTPSGQMQQATR